MKNKVQQVKVRNVQGARVQGLRSKVPKFKVPSSVLEPMAGRKDGFPTHLSNSVTRVHATLSLCQSIKSLSARAGD